MFTNNCDLKCAWAHAVLLAAVLHPQLRKDTNKKRCDTKMLPLAK